MHDAEIISIDLADRLGAARGKLAGPKPSGGSTGKALGAAALAAISALTLAAAVILGPGIEQPRREQPIAVEDASLLG